MRLRPQLTAFFTSVTILASSAAVNAFSAKAVGHMAPSSRFALSLKPNVAYLVLNFWAVWKKQTTLPSLPAMAYAGIPYQSLGERAGTLSLMIEWSRLPMVRSGSCISAIFASTAPSPSPLSALSSWIRSLIAPCSSSVNPLNFLLIGAVLLADFRLPFSSGFMKFCSSSEINYFSRVHSLPFNQLRWALVAGTARNVRAILHGERVGRDLSRPPGGARKFAVTVSGTFLEDRFQNRFRNWFRIMISRPVSKLDFKRHFLKLVFKSSFRLLVFFVMGAWDRGSEWPNLPYSVATVK